MQKTELIKKYTSQVQKCSAGEEYLEAQKKSINLFKSNMFTQGQIREAHAGVKSGADFPHYIQDLIVLGLQKYDIFVHDGHGEYFSAEGDTLVSPPTLPTGRQEYDTLTVADTSDAEGFTERLRAHQQGQTDYMTFCQDAANAGVEKWTVDTTAMTCTYYDKVGKMMLEERIPNIN